MNRNQKTRAVLPLDLQLFAGEGEQETNTEQQAGAENTETAADEGGTGGAEQTPTFDELLSSNKDYQSAFDSKITSALKRISFCKRFNQSLIATIFLFCVVYNILNEGNNTDFSDV